MEAITGWVAVGIFVVAISGEPSVKVQAAPEVFLTEAECAERLALVETKIKEGGFPEQVQVKAHGQKCVEILVKKAKSSALKPQL